MDLLNSNKQVDNQKVLSAFTGLRGIACIYIVVFHYFCVFYGADINSVPYGDFCKRIFQYSQYAVELFFMISGYLMTLRYRKRIETGIITFVSFYKRRIKGLLLSLIAVTMWSFIISLLNLGLVQKNIGGGLNLWRFFLSLSPFYTGWVDKQSSIGLPLSGTMWFIDILILCYLIFYAIVYLTKRKNSKLFTLICVFMVIIGYSCVTYQWEFPFLHYANGRGYLAFFMGALLCNAQDIIPEKNKRLFSSIFGIFIILAYIISVFLGVGQTYGNYYKFFSLVICPVIIMSTINIKWISRLLSIKPLIILGGLSGAVYFVHDNLFYTIKVIKDALIINYDFSDLWCLPILFIFVLIFALLWKKTIDKRISLLTTNTTACRK